MKYKVIGWTDWENDDIECGSATYAVCNAIIDCIKEKGLCFSGYHHQECFCCVPVLNDGKKRLFSQRGWGKLMAEAHGFFGPFDYSNFAYRFGKDDGLIMPDIITEEFEPEGFVPERNLRENFDIELDMAGLDSALETSQIRLDDIPRFRYLDMDDTLTLRCGSEALVFLVTDLERKQEFDLEKYKEHMKNVIHKRKDDYEHTEGPKYILVDLEFLRPQKG